MLYSSNKAGSKETEMTTSPTYVTIPEAYRRGEGTLAYAAQQAGISIRQIIPLAYAYGLTPKVDPTWLSDEV
jgi:hypothetical protein